MTPSKALVVLSGGQDSTTVLAYACKYYGDVRAITFDYGQRHKIEIESAIKVASIFGVPHEVITVPPFHGTSPLTNPDVSVEHYATPEEMTSGVEPTFVPGRNIVFISIASSYAAAHGIPNVLLGLSSEDYGGYPDCRPEFLGVMNDAIQRGLGNNAMQLHAPIMHLDKKGTVELAITLPKAMEALAWSHTCYDGEFPPNPSNHASILRARGFHQAGVADPLVLRAKDEGLLPEWWPDDNYITEGIPWKGDAPDGYFVNRGGKLSRTPDESSDSAAVSQPKPKPKAKGKLRKARESKPDSKAD